MSIIASKIRYAISALEKKYGKQSKIESVAVTKSDQRKFPGGCIATQLDGSCCSCLSLPYSCVPYCEEHLKKNGDPSLSVEQHPRFGFMLVAKRDLPKGYRVAVYGKSMTAAQMPDDEKELRHEFNKKLSGGNKEWISPIYFPHGQGQYIQCPGPNELPNVDYVQVSRKDGDDYRYVKNDEENGCMLYETIREVPKGYQLCYLYEDNEKLSDTFFEERGLTRCDVHTTQFRTHWKSYVKSEKDLMMIPRSKNENKKLRKAEHNKSNRLINGSIVHKLVTPVKKKK